MSERLSESEIFDMLIDNRSSVTGVAKHIFECIEADREAMRAETREEVLSAENVMSIEEIERRIYLPALASGVDQFAKPGTLDFGIWIKTKLYPAIQPLTVRRPAKKRPMTRKDKIKKLKEHFANQYAWLPDELKDGTIDDLCQAFGISTEVEE